MSKIYNISIDNLLGRNTINNSQETSIADFDFDEFKKVLNDFIDKQKDKA